MANPNPPSTLQFDLIKEMVANYRNNQLRSIINSAANPMDEDAHSIWFDLDTLKDFIAAIENEVAKNPGYAKSGLGLRLYYAAYPLKEKWNMPGYESLAPFLNDPVTQRYEKKHTLVMIPTIEADGDHVDFDPLNSDTYNGFKPAGNNPTMALVGSSETMAQNHGFLIPPKSSICEWF